MKWKVVAALVVCVGGIVWMLLSLGTNLDYMTTVTKALERRDSGSTFRVGGVVEAGSIDEATSRFRLTDGAKAMTVQLTGELAKGLTDCRPLVVRGHWQAGVFRGGELQFRHGATYSDEKHDPGVKDLASGCSSESAATGK